MSMAESLAAFLAGTLASCNMQHDVASSEVGFQQAALIQIRIFPMPQQNGGPNEHGGTVL